MNTADTRVNFVSTDHRPWAVDYETVKKLLTQVKFRPLTEEEFSEFGTSIFYKNEDEITDEDVKKNYIAYYSSRLAFILDDGFDNVAVFDPTDGPRPAWLDECDPYKESFYTWFPYPKEFR